MMMCLLGLGANKVSPNQRMICQAFDDEDANFCRVNRARGLL